MINIYVGNLSYQATEQELREMFASHGEVGNVTIIKDRDSGRSKGFGFVEMNDNSAGLRAIDALNGKDLGGRPLKINEARAVTALAVAAASVAAETGKPQKARASGFF